MKKKKIVRNVWLVVCLIILGTSGLCYCLWQLTLMQTESNLVSTTCFKIDFTEENDITLQNSYPITDEEGMRLTPYTFTIENICDTNATYQINLETLKGEGKRLSDEYLKLSLNNQEGKILNTLPEVLPTISNADVSHKLTTGVLKAREKKEFFLRLWMDEDTPPLDEVMNATHESKVTVTLIHKETIPDVTILASEYLDGIKVQNTVSNLGNDVLTYFYQLEDESVVESRDANYTFTSLNDGTYKVSVRIENQDGIIIKEETKNVVIAYEHVYVSSSGNDTTGIGSMDYPFLTLQPAYNKVKSGGEILLLSDITATSTTNMNIENKSVTLESHGDTIYTVIKDSAFTTQILDLTNSNTLTTTNIIFDGNEVISSAALIEAHNSTLNLNEGTTLQKNNNRGRYYSEWSAQGALGGGVYLKNSSLTISNATIKNNKTTNQNGSWSHGGGIAHYGGSLTLNNGIIANNENIGNIDNQVGGGLCLVDVIFIMNNGQISENKTQGSGGGIFFDAMSQDASMTMYDGKIINNTATLGHGGGIDILRETTTYNSIVTIKKGIIANNISQDSLNIHTDNGAQFIDER